VISRFYTKNLYKCGRHHKQSISKRTLRTSWLHFRKYIYLGYIHLSHLTFSKGGSVFWPTPCPYWLRLAPIGAILVKIKIVLDIRIKECAYYIIGNNPTLSPIFCTPSKTKSIHNNHPAIADPLP
jgi:hypothetical protein